MSRAAVITEPRQIAMHIRALRTPGPGEVRVRLEGCGVCASSLPVWEGRPWIQYPQTPGSPGHEGWGRVELVGDGVTSVSAGDRVVVLANAAYAEHVIASADALVVLPELLDAQPFPGEPLGRVMNILARSDIRAGQTVVVIGVGFIGAALIRLAAQRGARVVALSRREFSRELALHGGAQAVFPIDDTGRGVQDALDFIGSGGAERVIEAVGTQQTLDAASQLVATRGRLIIAASHQDGTRTVDLKSWNWRGIDVINAHERDPAHHRAGIEAAVHAVVSGQLDPRPLVTHDFPLEALDRAFAMLEERPDGFLKAVVTIA